MPGWPRFDRVSLKRHNTVIFCHYLWRVDLLLWRRYVRSDVAHDHSVRTAVNSITASAEFVYVLSLLTYWACHVLFATGWRRIPSNRYRTSRVAFNDHVNRAAVSANRFSWARRDTGVRRDWQESPAQQVGERRSHELERLTRIPAMSEAKHPGRSNGVR